MRIFYMVQFFEPEPAFKGSGFVRMLQAAGQTVDVVTGFPNYPGGKVYPGYRIRPFQRETVGGVEIARVPLYPSHDKSAIGRILNYITFAASSTIYGLLRAGRSDVIYIYHPPMTVALAGVIVGFIRRRPVVIEIQDLWPDTLAATGMLQSPRALAVVGAVCKLVYRMSTRIVAQSPGFRQRLIDRGVPASKIDLIYNWVDENDTKPKGQLDLAPYHLDGRFNVLFAGTMGLAQGLDVIIDTAKIVQAVEPRVQFLLVGSGIDAARITARIESEGVTNVRQMPHVPRDLVVDIQVAADVLLVTLRPDPLFEITIPSKTQTYLAVGKPIIMSAAGNAVELVAQADAGLSAPPGNPTALAEAVLKMARMPAGELNAMGQRGQAYYARELSSTSGIAKTIASLNRALADWRGQRDAG